MAKRFIDSKIWDEDWYLDMPNEYKLFWFYILSNCDHAGIFKVNLRSFCGLNGVNLSSKSALEYFNNGKARIRVINDNVWLIEDFFVFQYGTTLNFNNKLHISIINIYNYHKININSVRGLKEVKERSSSPLKEDKVGVKDKDKEIDIYSLTNSNTFQTPKRKGGMGENQTSEQKIGKDDFMCYDIEKFLQNNYPQFESICMKTGKSKAIATDELMKCHLHLTKKQLYPLQTKAAVAWFTSWLINADDFKAKYGAPKKEKPPESEPPKKHIDEILKKYQ